MRDGTREIGAAGAAVAGTGAATTAAAAAACCIGPISGPLLVGVIGASGAAWVSGLQPYAPYLLAAGLGFLVLGFRSIYRSRSECAVDEQPSRLRIWIGRLSVGLLWGSAVVWLGSTIAFFAFT